MFVFPKDYSGSWTLCKTICAEGIGLHSGDHTEVKVHPSEKAGFFVAFKSKPSCKIPISIEQVRHSQLCTLVDFGDEKLSTVEHLFAALTGLGITHAVIEKKINNH